MTAVQPDWNMGDLNGSLCFKNGRSSVCTFNRWDVLSGEDAASQAQSLRNNSPLHQEGTFGNVSSFVLNWGGITSHIFGGGSQVYSSNTDSCSQTAFKLTSRPECAMCEVAVSFVITRGKKDYGGGRQERVVLIFLSRLNVRSPPLLCPTLQYLEVASFICCRSIGRKCSQNPASLQMTQSMYHQMHFTNEAPTIHHDSPIRGVKNDLKMTVQTLKKNTQQTTLRFFFLIINSELNQSWLLFTEQS